MRRVTSWISLVVMSFGLVAAAMLFSAGTASASSVTCPYGTVCPAPTTPVTPSSPKPYTAPVAVASTATSGALAFTGTDVVGTSVVAVALIGTGALVVVASRRRRSA